MMFQSMVRFLAAGSACALLVMGCEIDNRKDSSDSSDERSESSNTSDTGDTTDGSKANPALPATPGGIAAGKKVGGNTADANGETDNFGNDDIWVDGSVSLGVRCRANDDKTDGIDPNYFCDSVVSDQGALKMIVWPDNTVVALGSDFISPRSGLVYKFKGFTANTSGSGLIGENPHIVSKSEQQGTFRAYWNTHLKP